MKTLLLLILAAATSTYGMSMNNLKQLASEVPTTEIDKTVSSFYKSDFKSDYVLVEFKDKSGETWYILDGYFTLADQTILFLDFIYDPQRKTFKPIDNYNFVPQENKRFLLKAEETCNPFKRNFIGVIAFSFHEPGFLDETLKFLSQELNGTPMLYTGELTI